MKQKRTFVTLLLIVAILCLGIAYAAVTSQELTISGSAGVADEDVEVNVMFTDADVTSKPDYATVTAEGTDTITATINVSDFKVKDDTAVVEYTITNKQTDMAATLENPVVVLSDGTPSGWFSVTCELAGTSLTANNEAGNLATASTTATVTVTLNETPVSAAQEAAATDTIEITIVANPVETSVQTGA